MSFEDFFKNNTHTSQNNARSDWGGTGSLPKLGKNPPHTNIPAVTIPQNYSKIAEPSANSVNMANQVIATYTQKSKG